MVPLQFLCVMTAVRVLTNVVGQILAAVGYPIIVFRYDIVTAIALPAGFFFGCKLGGLVGIGIAWCTVYPLVRLAFLLAAKRALHFSFSAYRRNLADSLWVSLVCGALMAPLGWMLPTGWLRLGVRTAIWGGGIVLCVALNRNLRFLIADTISNHLGSNEPVKP